MARAALKLGVREVAAMAKVSPATVTRIEADQPANSSTLAAIRSALEAAGVKVGKTPSETADLMREILKDL